MPIARAGAMQPGMGSARAAIWVVGIACLLRLIFAGFTGLGIDESYMVAASDRFCASYFDHPLASWWLELASRWLFGAQTPVVVRLPFIALSAVTSWLIFLLTARFYGARAGFWAVAAYTLSPVFSLAFGCWVLPDGPLDAALVASAYALARAIGLPGGTPQPRWWWLAGVFGGLALLSKYSAVLVFAGGALAVLTDPASRSAWRRLELYGAKLIGIVMLSPVMFWNATHGFASFQYQGGRAMGGQLHPLAPLTILGGEALFLLPWIWLPMVLLMLAALWRGPAERRGWFLACMAVVPILLFCVIGLWSSTKILYHWATPGYLMLFPLLGNYLAGFAPRWRNGLATLTALLLAGAALMLTAEISLNFIPDLDRVFAPGKSPLLQVVDWDSLRAQIPPGVEAVGALRWYDAGKIGYALGRAMPVTVFGPQPHEFAFSAPASSLTGKNFLLLAMPGNAAQIGAQYAPYFKTLAAGPGLTVMHRGSVLLVIPSFIGTDLLRAPP